MHKSASSFNFIPLEHSSQTLRNALESFLPKVGCAAAILDARIDLYSF